MVEQLPDRDHLFPSLLPFGVGLRQGVSDRPDRPRRHEPAYREIDDGLRRGHRLNALWRFTEVPSADLSAILPDDDGVGVCGLSGTKELLERGRVNTSRRELAGSARRRRRDEKR